MKQMYRIIFTAIIALLCSMPTWAKYTVHSVKGNVTVNRNHTEVPLSVGMELNPNDLINIPQGANVEIFNSMNSLVFSSVRSGKYSVTKIIIDAQMQAKDNNGAVVNNLRMGKNKADGYMYVDAGKVTRALAEFDPEGENTEVNPHEVALRVADLLDRLTSGTLDESKFPLQFATDASSAGVQGFSLANTMQFPIYFNLVKLPGGNASQAAISELGQPVGCYVLLPGQSLSRAQNTSLAPADKHVLIITHYYFDIDKLIENVAEILGSPSPVQTTSGDLPVYVKVL